MKTWSLFLRRFTGIFIGLIFIILILAIAGAAYQFIATFTDQRNFPAPGQLVDVGGFRMHIYCTGIGSPTVLLESAADMMSADWGWIRPEIAKQTRVCAYDRAGMGWSDPSPLPRDARQVSAELHLLLNKAGIEGPYILVGHSVGGLYVRMFANQYPEEVVGMVLVDPGHPDMDTRIPALQAQNQSDAQLVRTMQILSYVGIPRLLGVGKTNAAGLPVQQVAEVNAFVSTPRHWASLLELIQATPKTYDEVRKTGSLGDRPLVVLSADTAWFSPGAPADDARQTLNELHAELAGLSTNSSHRIVAGATHASLVHDQKDAQATILAIADVLRSAQTGLPLAR